MSDAGPEEREEVPTAAAEAYYVLRLYVTGSNARSAHAIENMRRICDEYLAGRHELQVVDIYQRPEAAREFQLIAAPTLVKLLPAPLRRIVGDLSDQHKVLVSLEIRSAHEGDVAGGR
jgi:circadian clock protein KaiB